MLRISKPSIRGTLATASRSRANREEILAGDIWFYYGSRYGEYLSVTHQGNPEDYLPAMLEGTPARSDAYFTLADYYRDVGQLASALDDFAHAVELSSQRGDAHDRMAQILWQQGKQDEAIKEWSLALKAFRAQEDRPHGPAHFLDGPSRHPRKHRQAQSARAIAG